MKTSIKKEENQQPSMGIVIVACLNFIFAVVAALLGSSAIFLSTPLGFTLYLKSALLLTSGLGLWDLKFWAWLLTVAMCVFGLIAFALNQNAIPLELIVFPYLLIKRKDFGK
jgi:hypothetical protein